MSAPLSSASTQCDAMTWSYRRTDGSNCVSIRSSICVALLLLSVFFSSRSPSIDAVDDVANDEGNDNNATITFSNSLAVGATSSSSPHRIADSPSIMLRFKSSTTSDTNPSLLPPLLRQRSTHEVSSCSARLTTANRSSSS